MGYGGSTKGYKLWDPMTHKLIISTDVIFEEDSSMGKGKVRSNIIVDFATQPLIWSNQTDKSDGMLFGFTIAE